MLIIFFNYRALRIACITFCTSRSEAARPIWRYIALIWLALMGGLSLNCF